MIADSRSESKCILDGEPLIQVSCWPKEKKVAMTEPFDAVLAEVEKLALGCVMEVNLGVEHYTEILDRLAAAHAAEVGERDARLNGEQFAHEQTKRALAEATETWTDEAGNAWRPATAWAYAQSCRVRDEMRARAEAAEAMHAQQGLNIIAAIKRADAAMGLLREVTDAIYSRRQATDPAITELLPKLQAALAEQAQVGGENGNG